MRRKKSSKKDLYDLIFQREEKRNWGWSIYICFGVVLGSTLSRFVNIPKDLLLQIISYFSAPFLLLGIWGVFTGMLLIFEGNPDGLRRIKFGIIFILVISVTTYFSHRFFPT